MKNLVIQSDEAASLFDGSADADACCVCCMAINSPEGKMYVATGSGVRCVSLARPKVFEWVQQLSLYGDGQVVSLCYVAEMEALCVGLSSGELLLLHCDEEGGAVTVEEVGGIEGGLCALEWSPDGEVFAIISGAARLLVMNMEWELLFEASLPGTEASDTDAAVTNFDIDAQISWRGDAKYFATICKVASGGSTHPRAIHIWERASGEVHARAEGAELYSPVLTWQPNGRHLYTALAAGLRHQEGDSSSSSSSRAAARVLMFERNGLQHGGFDLPQTSTAGDVAAMSWSCDSELLAVMLAPSSELLVDGAGGAGADEGSRSWTLQIWHRSNWHWYLKQERRYLAEPLSASPTLSTSAPLSAAAPLLLWDESHGRRLHVLCRRGSYECLTFGWSICVSSHGTAAVVDGCNLLITPMRHGLVPPPMSSAKASFPAPLVAVSLGWAPLEDRPPGASCPPSAAVMDDGDELIAGVMSDGRLAVMRSVESDLWEETMEEQMELSGNEGGLGLWIPDLGGVPLASGRCVRELCWLGPTRLLLLATAFPDGLETEKGADVLLQLLLSWPQDGSGVGGIVEEGPPLFVGGPSSGKQMTGCRVLSVSAFPPGSSTQSAIVQLSNGQLLHFTPSDDMSGPGCLSPLEASVSFPQACPAMWVLPADGSSSGGDVAMGLSASGHLYWGSTLVAAEVTSAALRCGGAGGPALLYTTRRSLLYTVFLTQLEGGHQHKELVAGAGEQDSHKRKGKKGEQRDGEMRAAMHTAMKPLACNAAARDVMVRAVEQGSVLVAVPYGGVNVVLQMPRGNLEGVAPRALVLAAIVVGLSELNYGLAWELATKHRVDLNLIVDYSWPSFLSQAPKFVSEVTKASDLCDLIFALKPGSVLATGGMYANTIDLPTSTREAEAGGNKQHAGVSSANKVDAVCSALRAAVDATQGGPSKFLTVTVTSYARSDPPQLEAALACIRDTKEAALKLGQPTVVSQASEESHPLTLSLSSAYVGVAPASTSGATHQDGHVVGIAERALKHLLLNVDADDLYCAALAMYDLPLAYMVVVNAQKDPGEYMCELQGFAAVSNEMLRHHRIDMHLHRYGSALSNLVKAGPQHFDQALQLARSQGLLRQLLLLYQDDAVRAPLVLEACGDSLAATAKHEDAGAAYAAAGKFDKALTSYRSATVWRMVFVMAARLQYSSAAMQQLAAEFADELVFSGQLGAAANVHLLYLQDVDTAVSLFAKAKEWREAQRAAYHQSRVDLLDTVLAPAAAEASSMLLSDIREAAERITKYWARLKEVRGKRLAMQLALEEAEEDGGLGDLEADAMSDAASVVSGLSMYTDNTHSGKTAAGSASRAASTVGGKKPHKPKRGHGKSGNKIRQGSPGEEKSLIELVRSQAPTATALEESSQLMELLVMLGHLPDARVLQQQIAALIQLHQEAVSDIARHTEVSDKAGDKTLVDAVAVPKEVAWKLDILRPV